MKLKFLISGFRDFVISLYAINETNLKISRSQNPKMKSFITKTKSN
jgi:hypothetical protein